MSKPRFARSLSAVVLGGVLAASLSACLGDDEEKAAANACTSGNDVASGYGAIDEDKLAERLIAARREAGSWGYTQTAVTAGARPQVMQGKVEWDGETTKWTHGTAQYPDVFMALGEEWYYHDFRESTGKPWIHLKPNKATRNSFEAIARALDPSRSIGIFADPLECEVLGLDGKVAAVQYRLTLDVEKIHETMEIPVVGNVGDRRIYEIWVDQDDNLVKQVETSSAGGIETTTTHVWSGFGQDTDLQPPPKNQTFESSLPVPEPEDPATEE